MNQDKVEEYFRLLMTEGLGLDLADPNLEETPERMAKMYCKEFFSSLNKDPDFLVKNFPNDKGYDNIIMMDNIPFVSTCPHHLLPFQGLAFFLYIPDLFLIGASKPARAISFFSKTLELQEHLSSIVMSFLVKEAKPLGAMLVMRAIHNCISCRGVNTGLSAGMTTSSTYGGFRDNLSTRMEGLSLIQLSVSLK